jgi:hypothetical protein
MGKCKFGRESKIWSQRESRNLEGKVHFLIIFDRFFLMLLLVKSGNFTQRVQNIFSFSYTEIRPTISLETNVPFFSLLRSENISILNTVGKEGEAGYK